MEKHIIFLENALSEFNIAARLKNTVKKQAERNNHDSNMQNQIQIVELYLKKNEDLHQIFLNQHLGFIYEEALSQLFFSRDFNHFINFLKNDFKT